jgi:glycosyltransferase involved in cell wall biosynthesis
VRIFTASTRIGGRQCPNRRGESVQDGVSFRFIPTREYQGNGVGRALNMAEFARGSVRAMREAASAGERPDVIIASSPQPFMWPGSARMARLLGAAFVPDIRDAWPESLRDLAGLGPLHPLVLASERALRSALRHAALVTSPLPNAGLHLREHGFGALRWLHVPNGISLPVGGSAGLPEDARIAIATARQEGRRVALYAGAIGVPNALSDLFEAVRRLPATCRQRLAFVIAGSGTEVHRLHAASRTAEPASFRFLGEREQTEVQAIARACDAGVALRTAHRVYRFGVSPQKLPMYLACGLPVIYSSTDPEDPVARDRLGWWTQAGDVDALSSTVEEFSRISDDHLAALAERCREHARTKFDWDRIAERCLMALPMRTFRGIGHD